MADEDGLAAPFDDYLVIVCQLQQIRMGRDGVYVFALWDSSQVDFDFGLCENVGGGGHVD